MYYKNHNHSDGARGAGSGDWAYDRGIDHYSCAPCLPDDDRTPARHRGGVLTLRRAASLEPHAVSLLRLLWVLGPRRDGHNQDRSDAKPLGEDARCARWRGEGARCEATHYGSQTHVLAK